MKTFQVSFQRVAGTALAIGYFSVWGAAAKLVQNNESKNGRGDL